MNRPLRVGFVLHVMQVAGAEVLVREIIHRLGNRIVPTIFCLDAVGQIGEQLRREGIDLVCFDRKPGRDWSVSFRMARAIRQRKIDIIHAHQYSPFFYAALAKCLSLQPLRLILTEHGRHYPDVVSPKRRAVNRLILDRLAAATTACCRFSAKGLSRNDGFAGARMAIIENGIDADRYGPAENKADAKARLGLLANRRFIVHVARHHPVKDQATLLRGFALMAPRNPDVDLLLVGDGPLRRQLESLARDLRIHARAQFFGVRSDVSELMSVSDIFALTSLSEAASLTLLEAMASGLPVVVTDVGGSGEIVRHETEGLLIPRGDSSACAAAFHRLSNDKVLAEKMGMAGRQRVRQHYRLDRTVERYFELYCRLMGSRTAGIAGITGPGM
jgi:glycosyltransferase involved in cell wall biosynthesis